VIAAGCAVVFVCLMRDMRANWPSSRVATISGRSILVGNVGAIASPAPLTFLLGFVDWCTVWYTFAAITFACSTVLWIAMVDAHEPRRLRDRIRCIGQELRGHGNLRPPLQGARLAPRPTCGGLKYRDLGASTAALCWVGRSWTVHWARTQLPAQGSP
jgi:hypothetical protein